MQSFAYDSFFYEGRECQVLAMSEELNFDITPYGIKPGFVWTNWIRGYLIDYNIEDEELKVKNIYVLNSKTGFPPINGVSGELRDDIGEAKCIYEDVNITANYTGKLVIGLGFLEKFRKITFNECFLYEKILELTFLEGVLLDIVDFSEQIKNVRELTQLRKKARRKKERKKPVTDEDFAQYVCDVFSVDSESDVWWIENHYKYKLLRF